MMTDQQVLYHCFEKVAESAIDLTPAVYARFIESMPQASQHIGYMDSRMQGRMLDQIYKLLLGESDSGYLEFETKVHKGYGADTGLYRGLLMAIKAAMKDTMAQAWGSETDAAWDRTIDRIIKDIAQVESAPATL